MTSPKSSRMEIESPKGRRIDSREILIEEIVVPSGDRLRELREAAIEEKRQSMTEVGQISPILLRSEGGVYELLAGLHRLEAAKRLGWERIRADVWECDDALAWLLQIDDNLASTKLTVLDLSMSLHERKSIYEAENPDSRHGGDRKSSGRRKNQNEIISFCSAAAQQLGWSKRRVEMLVAMGGRARQVYKGAPWYKRLRGTSAASHFVELREFFNDKANDEETRLRIVAALRAEAPPRSVRAARDKIVGMDRRSSEDVAYHDLGLRLRNASPRVRAAFFYYCAKGDARGNFAAEMAEAVQLASEPGSRLPPALLNPLEAPKLKAAPKLLPAAAAKKKG